MIVTNEFGLPQPFVDAATSSYQYKENYYSVTSLLKSTRQTLIERRHHNEAVADCSERIWAILGSAVHKILEEAQEGPNQLKEGRIDVPIFGGYRLSGYFDLFDIDSGTVTDYKTASVWKVQFGDFDEWRKQVLLYTWGLRQMGYDANAGQIVAILKDHSLRDARFKSDYPKRPVFVIKWEFTEHDFELAEAFVFSKFKEIYKNLDTPDDELPYCTPQERWAKPEKWAVIKPGTKKARKLFDNPNEAYELANKLGLSVEHRPGEDTRCISYCAAAPWCNQCKAVAS